MSKKKKAVAGSKPIGIFGGVSSSLGIVGLHNVCHALCQGAIAVLAIIGITVVGMPLAFLQDYSFFFSTMGLLSASVAIIIFVWNKFRCEMKTSNKQVMWLSFNIGVLFLSLIGIGGIII